MPYSLPRRKYRHARHTFQTLPIALSNHFAFANLTVQVAQVAYAHRSAELVHLGVATHVLHVLRSRDAEILPLVEQRVEGLVPEAHSATFYSVEHLGGVKAEHSRVTKGRGGTPLAVGTASLHAERVRSVVDHLQTVPVSYLLDSIHVAQVAVDVHGHDGAGARSYHALN